MRTNDEAATGNSTSSIGTTQSIPKLHTPIILRTGLFHSYWRTLLPQSILFVILFTLYYIEGSIPQVLNGLPFLIFWMIIMTSGVWLIRDVLTRFDELFGLFDEETKRGLKIYTSLKQPQQSAPQDNIRLLFRNTESSDNYLKKLRSLLFHRTEYAFIVLALAIYTIGAILFFSTPDAWTELGVTNFPWSHITTILAALVLLEVAICLFSAFHLFTGIWRSINLIGKSGKDLRVWRYVDRLQGGEPTQDEAMMSYKHFYNNASAIGRFVYTVTYRIVLLLISAAVFVILLDFLRYYSVSFTTWLLSVGVVMAGLIIFLAPQLELHEVLSKAKDAVGSGLEQEHSRIKIRYIESLRKMYGTPDPESSIAPEHKEIRNDLDTLRVLIQDTQKSATWSFRMPMALKILFTSLIPIIVTILETMLPIMLIP